MDTLLKKNNITRQKMFVCVSLIGIISFFVFALFKGADMFTWLVMNNQGEWLFGDFFQHEVFMQDARNIYTDIRGVWGSFPPLIYLFYWGMFSLTKSDATYDIYDYHTYWTAPYVLWVFLIYMIFVILLLVYAVRLWCGTSKYRGLLCCLLLSVPFLAGGLERGNSCILVVILLLISLKWRDDDSQVKRELALLCVAICACFKVYPIVFSLLYIKEKRWKEFWRLVVYTVVLFFGPFVVFQGLVGIKAWFENILMNLVESPIGRINFIGGVISTICYYIAGQQQVPLVGLFGTIVFGIMLMLFILTGENKKRVVFFLCAMMTFIPGNAFRYTLCYLAIPLILEWSSYEVGVCEKDFQTVECLLFSFVYTIPTIYGFITGFRGLLVEQFTRLTYVDLWTYGCAYILVVVMSVHEITDLRKSSRCERCATA